MKVKERLEALEVAYGYLIDALKAAPELDEVDPEKRKAAMSMFKLAQEDSRKIFDEINELTGMTLVSEEAAEIINEKEKEQSKKKTTSGLSPEARIKR